jgi:hypothetical protein
LGTTFEDNLSAGWAGSLESKTSEFLSFTSIVLLTSLSLADLVHISKSISLRVDVNKNV